MTARDCRYSAEGAAAAYGGEVSRHARAAGAEGEGAVSEGAFVTRFEPEIGAKLPAAAVPSAAAHAAAQAAVTVGNGGGVALGLGVEQALNSHLFEIDFVVKIRKCGGSRRSGGSVGLRRCRVTEQY